MLGYNPCGAQEEGGCPFCPPPDCAPCPCPPPPASCACNTAYAQYAAMSNGPSLSRIPLRLLAEEGGLVQAAGTDTLTLSAGHIYLVGYTFLATPEDGQYFQIVPEVGGALKLLYSTAGSASGTRIASAAGSFLVTETAAADATLAFRLTYGEGTRNIDLTGVVYAVPVAAARQ